MMHGCKKSDPAIVAKRPANTARHPARGGPESAAALREHAVLVRHFNKPRTAPICVSPSERRTMCDG